MVLRVSEQNEIGDSVELVACRKVTAARRVTGEADESIQGGQNATQRLFQGPVGGSRDVRRRGTTTTRTAPKGLPPLTIKDVKVITTSGGRNYRWVFLKIITSEPGLYGIGSANDNYQTQAVVAALEKHLKPWLIGKDPDRIEDLWQSANFKTYWRERPGQQQSGRRDGRGARGTSRASAPACRFTKCSADARTTRWPATTTSPHAPRSRPRKWSRSRWRPASATSACSTARADTAAAASSAPNEGNRAEGGYQGQAFDEDLYVETIPPVFEYVRSKVGIRAQAAARRPLAPDRRATRSSSAKKMEPYHMYFVEDLLGPEHLDWYPEVRKACATPQAVGEVFSNPAEYYPLIAERT